MLCYIRGFAGAAPSTNVHQECRREPPRNRRRPLCFTALELGDPIIQSHTRLRPALVCVSRFYWSRLGDSFRGQGSSPLHDGSWCGRLPDPTTLHRAIKVGELRDSEDCSVLLVLLPPLLVEVQFRKESESG